MEKEVILVFPDINGGKPVEVSVSQQKLQARSSVLGDALQDITTTTTTGVQADSSIKFPLDDVVSPGTIALLVEAITRSENPSLAQASRLFSDQVPLMRDDIRLDHWNTAALAHKYGFRELEGFYLFAFAVAYLLHGPDWFRVTLPASQATRLKVKKRERPDDAIAVRSELFGACQGPACTQVTQGVCARCGRVAACSATCLAQLHSTCFAFLVVPPVRADDMDYEQVNLLETNAVVPSVRKFITIFLLDFNAFNFDGIRFLNYWGYPPDLYGIYNRLRSLDAADLSVFSAFLGEAPDVNAEIVEIDATDERRRTGAFALFAFANDMGMVRKWLPFMESRRNGTRGTQRNLYPALTFARLKGHQTILLAIVDRYPDAVLADVIYAAANDKHYATLDICLARGDVADILTQRHVSHSLAALCQNFQIAQGTIQGITLVQRLVALYNTTGHGNSDFIHDIISACELLIDADASDALMLITKNTNINTNAMHRLLEDAFEEGARTCIKALVDHPGLYPLPIGSIAEALVRGPDPLKALDILLAAPNFDPTSNDNELFKSLLEPIVRLNQRLVPLLKRLLADPRIDPAFGQDHALATAVTQGNVPIVQLLLADPRVNQNPHPDWFPLALAIRLHWDSIAKLLISDPRTMLSAFDNRALKEAFVRASDEIAVDIFTDPRFVPGTAEEARTLLQLAYARGRHDLLKPLRRVLLRTIPSALLGYHGKDEDEEDEEQD
jgi:hypothetical protein